MIQGQLPLAYSSAAMSNAPILGSANSVAGYGQSYGGGYAPPAGNNTPVTGANQLSGDISQQMMTLISTILTLLTALLPQLLGGQQGGQNPPTPGGYGAGNPYGGQVPGNQGAGQNQGPGLVGPGKGLANTAPQGLQAFQKEINNASSASGVPANVLGAMIWQESRGNLQALTTNGGNGLTDTGLMQVNPNTYKELQAKHPELQGMNDLSDPQTNIMAGAFFMRDLIDQFGDIPTALRAYNSGPNGVDRNNLNALPAGTGDATYVDKVLDFTNRLASGAALPP